MTTLIDKLADILTGPLSSGFGVGVRILGPMFIIGFYALLGLHIYGHFSVIFFVLKRRLGTALGLAWIAIGLILVYNITFNHLFAFLLKPGSPKDLLKIEDKRKIIK